jgi:predicted nucleotidyltransferase
MNEEAAAVRPSEDPVLKRFRAALDELYGDRLERAVLYGSQARGDHRPDSDSDIAVFIKGYGTFIGELRRLSRKGAPFGRAADGLGTSTMLRLDVVRNVQLALNMPMLLDGAKFAP